MPQSDPVSLRRTFAIISHPDAGKTTITEKLLLLGCAIQLAGTVKARKSDRHATSDWMAMEKERGISVTTSVMQFPYRDYVVNLLDTPGHEDFSEDTYRTLTAVDSALMVIDGAKGVEPRTIKLMEICRMRDTPILTFVNKTDREMRDPIDLLDEIEDVLKIQCAPITWPLGMGRRFRGVYHFTTDKIICYESGHAQKRFAYREIQGLNSDEARMFLGDEYDEFVAEIGLVQGASHQYDRNEYRRARLSPVYFGSALQNFGVDHMLDGFVEKAPEPQPRETDQSVVEPRDDFFSGFVFKIQANMDPRHRDRLAFLRVCSGTYRHGMRMRHVRLGKDIKVNDAVTFLAGERVQATAAWPGDIIGLHNHGSIRIGDTFTANAATTFHFRGIPNFAPELFRAVRTKDPLKGKQLEKGLEQLSEEGASQVFRPLTGNTQIVGAVGSLQFDLVAFRLQDEYRAQCLYAPVAVKSARWIYCDDAARLEEFRNKNLSNLALDGGGCLTYLVPNRANLQLVQERWPDIQFSSTREH